METLLLNRPGIHNLHVAKSEAATPKAKLLLIHGFGEHSARYEHFAVHCNASDISLYTFDLIGHGHSEGLRAYLPSKDIVSDDVDAVRAHFNLHTDTYLMGHSMGGLFAVRYAMDNRREGIKGLILSGALLEIDKDMSPLLQKLAPILAAILPKLKTTPLDQTYLTRSAENLKAYNTDPLIYRDGIRAKTGALSIAMVKEVNQKFGKISIPLLALHGSEDRVTMPGGTKKLHEEAISQDKTIHIYDGLYHELVNEPEREMVMNDITTWILHRS